MTLLSDGRVFLLGDTAAVAEIRNPATGVWTDSSSLGAYRSYATATVLQDGRVLVAGGYNSSSSPTTGLLYDPSTNTWSPTGPHVTPRWMHTAAALPDGRVLIIGGRQTATPTASLATAEVYDPATNTWTAAGTMATPRTLHASTLLPSGEIVVTGGQVDAVSGHLTATGADPKEVASWSAALGRAPAEFPVITSTKSLIGHALGAAGAIESVAAVLMLEGGFVHASRNCEDVHPEIAPFAPSIPHETRELPSLSVMMKAGFGFGDVNAALVLRKWA